MQKEQNNYAFIDWANLHKGTEALGWSLDYGRFRVWLSEKYGVTKAYLFLGFLPWEQNFYVQLSEAGFTLVHKDLAYGDKGKIKANCDADLVLGAVVDYYENCFDRAVLVSSDGDFASLVKFLEAKGAFCALISPHKKCSYLLKKLNIPIVYLDTQKNILELLPQKEKAPGGDETPQGPLS
jgi:uncharacterized LabA/DUF88 family protein